MVDADIWQVWIAKSRHSKLDNIPHYPISTLLVEPYHFRACCNLCTIFFIYKLPPLYLQICNKTILPVGANGKQLVTLAPVTRHVYHTVELHTAKPAVSHAPVSARKPPQEVSKGPRCRLSQTRRLSVTKAAGALMPLHRGQAVLHALKGVARGFLKTTGRHRNRSPLHPMRPKAWDYFFTYTGVRSSAFQPEITGLV